MKFKEIFKRVVSVAVAVALLLSLQRLLQPKYATSLREGSYTSQYYDEEKDHQVLMVGDCELYENFDPITLWNNYGITSYIRGNAQQLTWQSYYLLKEALKYEKPEVVVFNVMELSSDEPEKEEYNRLVLDNMKWSKEKVDAINASMMEDEEFIDYLFPILRYHSRITELTSEDFDYYFKGKNNTIAGYYMRMDTKPYEVGAWGDENYVGKYTDEALASKENAQEESENEEQIANTDEAEEEWSAEADVDEAEEEWSAEADVEEEEEWSAEADSDEGWSAEADGDESSEEEWSAEADVEEDEEFDDESDEETEEVEPLGENSMHYLDLIRTLCEENDIELLLVKAPSVSPKWYDEWDEEIVEYADKYNLNYINYLNLVDEIGIDYTTDTYDEGLHMNYQGALKCADYLGQYLTENYNLKDLCLDKEISKVWEEKAKQQEELKEAQLQELDKYGELRSYK